MFNISDLSIVLWSTEKSNPFPFRDTSLESIGLNAIDMLSWKNWVGELAFLIIDFKLIDFFVFNKQITIIMVVM